MDSLVLHRTDSNSSSLKSGSEKENVENIPTWKVPLTSSLIGKSRHQDEDKSKRDSTIPKKAQISPELAEDEATAQLIQILLPCIICNRTFSPEALERHAKICASVNTKDPKKQNRGTFDSSEQRKKDTKIADFIPPPPMDSNGEFVRTGSRRLRDSFSRGSKNRSSLGKTSSTCNNANSTTITTTNITTTSSIPTWKRGPTSPIKATPPATLEILKPVEPYESNSEFGSEESQDTDSKCGRNVPSYARALSPSEDCPYCGRNFVIKAYDRHVKFCQDVYIRKQYEHQPIPKEKEEAMERQELRTKYKPLKGSTSCGSLRSMSPPKDFPSMMAMKFYGFMNKTFNRNNFKKSNESLSNSCYGDYTRSMRKTSPAPSVASTITNNHKPLMYQRSNTMHTIKGSPVMRVNTSSNIPKRTKSIENLNLANVASSGYGQQHTSNNSSNSFTRNSKTRSSLHKNFFRNSSKRVEPEGTENTSSSGSPGALIITPMSFYSKGKNYSPMMESQLDSRQKQLQNSIPNNNLLQHNTLLMNRNNSQSHHANHVEDMRKKSPLLNSDPTYDPYEKAARQFEELLKSQPARNNESKQSNRSQARKVGLDRAFRSVADPFMPEFDDEDQQKTQKIPPSMTQSMTTHSMNNNNSSGISSSFSKPQNNIKTEVNSFVFNPSDDTYWDQILKKSNVKSSTSSEETQDDSQTTSDSDNGKPRAVSNISSVDSAFSRTDGADLEFEALETLVSLGDVPPSSVSNQGGGGPVLPPVIDSSKSSFPPRRDSSSTILSPLSTTNCQHSNDGNPGMTMSKAKSPESTCLPLLANNQQKPENNSLYSSLHNSRDKDRDVKKINGLSKTIFQGGSEASTNNTSVTLAKFCHECGTPYPTTTAKFCPECGERRVMK